MQLVGQLSRPSPRLVTVLAAYPDGPLGLAEPAVAQASKAPRYGDVEHAILAVLGASSEPMRRAEIQTGVEQRLGQPIPNGTIYWRLWAGVRAERPKIERVGYGLYRLRVRS
jgi:hypothetical protein